MLGGLFVLGQFAFLGWVGPGPVFFAWSIAAAPLLALTAWWLKRYVTRMPWRTLAALGASWAALLAIGLFDPITELHGVGPWAALGGMLFFPPLLTFIVLAWVEDRVPVRTA